MIQQNSTLEPISQTKIIEKVSSNRCPKHNLPLEISLFGTGEYKRQVSFCPECKKTERHSFEFEKRQQEIRDALQRANISPRFTEKSLGNFKIENKNQEQVINGVYQFLAQFESSTGLIFMGKPGTGKSHLSTAIAKEVIYKKGRTAVITTAMKMIRQIKSSWKDESTNEETAIRKFITPDLLVIDEIGVQFGSDTERLYLTEIINDRYEWMKQTIILTNLTTEELQHILGERVLDRFKEGGQVLIFDWKSYRGRKA